METGMDRSSKFLRRIGRGLVFLSLFLICCGRVFAWEDGDYSWYDYLSFQGLPAANERIDMEHIDYSLLNAAVFYATNEERVRNGLPAFRHSLKLELAAMGHSADMARNGYLSHESQIEDKKTIRDRITGAGLVFRDGVIGENIADAFGIEYEGGKPVWPPQGGIAEFRNPENGEPIKNHTYWGAARAVVKAWMNSPYHRDNILNRDFTFLGAGCAHFKEEKFYGIDTFKMTQDFSSNIAGNSITGGNGN